MVILGIGGLLRNAAAALLKDGVVLAAIEEAKLSRHHRPGALPEAAIASCLDLAHATPDEVDCVALVRPISQGSDSNVHLHLRARFPRSEVVMVDHHRAHASSAFFASPFENATVLTLDRSGDYRCGARWHGTGAHMQLERELFVPDSLGELYTRTTELLGFAPRADEHKVQWLSAGGDAQYRQFFLDILGMRDVDWPRIDRTYFDENRLGKGGFSAKFYEAIGLEDGQTPPEVLKRRLAAGLQHAIETAVLRMAGEGDNLCLAGGLGLNALLVAALERCGRWRNVFVQPVAGNSGAALGAVFHGWHHVAREKRRAEFPNLFLGPDFTAEEIKKVLENCKLRFRYLLTTGELIDSAVTQLGEDRIVAWMHGRAEFGPRALGNRSILASPRNVYSTENLNVFIKHREPFRKFAASVPAELAGEYFDVGPNARFLATVGRVRPAHKETFAGAVLGEDLVRVHTVSREDNPLYWQLLHAAGKSTGLPVLYNTSFNLFGDPLVCTPRDAVRSFYSSGIDALFVGNFLLQK